MMIDCKAHPEASFWPHLHFIGQRFKLLVLSNLDRDHASDLHNMLRWTQVERILANPSVSAAALDAMKRPGGMDDGIMAFCDIRANAPWVLPADLSPVQYRSYYLTYGQDFTDTNNLSVVLIVQYGAFKIMFCGDMEEAGWRCLMNRTEFLLDFVGVNVMVAPHHGRDGACIEALFKIHQPDIFIISDKEKIHETQETTAWYRDRAHGLPVIGTTDTRYVLTTRADGNITIEVPETGRWLVTPSRSTPPFASVLGAPRVLGIAGLGEPALDGILASLSTSPPLAAPARNTLVDISELLKDLGFDALFGRPGFKP
jgi:beta-lactamase superfamily II metal-dependent hydrolase